MPGTPGAFAGSAAAQQRAREQQAVLNRLRAGQAITGSKPADPIIGGIQSLFGGAGAGTIPSLNAAKLGGQEVLMNRGGWDTRVAGSGPVNIGGQTWYPAQSGQDLVYKRAPGNVGGQYGSIFSKDQLTPPPAPNLPGRTSPAAERAYQSEASRVAQMTAQNPDLQRYSSQAATAAKSGDQAKMDAARDIGMQMWAKANPTLAANVKPGQSGYEAIQGVLNAGQMGAPLDLPFNPSNPLSTTPAPPTAEYGQGAPASLPPGAAVPTNAYGNVRPGMFQRFRDQSSLEVSPLGTTAPLTDFSYGGAVQPIGSAIVDEAFKTDKARQMAEMYKNALLGWVK